MTSSFFTEIATWATAATSDPLRTVPSLTMFIFGPAIFVAFIILTEVLLTAVTRSLSSGCSINTDGVYVACWTPKLFTISVTRFDCIAVIWWLICSSSGSSPSSAYFVSCCFAWMLRIAGSCLFTNKWTRFAYMFLRRSIDFFVRGGFNRISNFFLSVYFLAMIWSKISIPRKLGDVGLSRMIT